MLKKVLLMFNLLFLCAHGYGERLYEKLKLEEKISPKVFNQAIKGLNKIMWEDLRYLVIIDYTKPSTEPRFSVIDLRDEKLLYYTYVTHAKNSGKLYARKFSNIPNSYQSSLGFYISDFKKYKGEFGESLRLLGLEERFNSNAKIRNIVIHGAEYASKEYASKVGFLGRTLGCPAIPLEISYDVVNLLAGKSLIYIAGNDERYLSESKFLN